MKNIKSILLLLAGLFIFIYACEKDGATTAKFNLHLTDAPADYDSVLIDIQSVEVHFQTGDDDGEWMVLENLNAGIYDLLKLNNGLDTLLASTDLPAGTISQIRLILGENNSLFIDDEEFALKTPSAQTSGLKLNVHANLEAGITYDMWIDFDAARSIVSTGSGKYNLKPVIRTYTEATSGGIKGFVTPIDSETTVTITVDGNDVSTIIDVETGFFMLSGIPADIYNVVFTPKDLTAYEEQTIENVEVVVSSVTDIGTVELVAVTAE